MGHTILLYGESGLFKTTQIGLFADYQFELTGHPVYLATCDSDFMPCRDQVERGTLIPLQLEACPHPVPVINKLSKGMWPIKCLDQAAGLWDLSDVSTWKPLDFKRVGGLAVEGLTRICELASKEWCEEGRSNPRGQFTQMGENFAFRSQSMYGDIQQMINNAVINYRKLPTRVLWTAHESKGKDLTGLTKFGPATMGPALTNFVSGWFGITLHLESYQYQQWAQDGKRILTRNGVRAFFERHPDPELSKMFWPCKLGVTPALTAQIYSQWEEGYFPLILNMGTGEYECGIHTFLKVVDSRGIVVDDAPLPQRPEIQLTLPEAEVPVETLPVEVVVDAPTAAETQPEPQPEPPAASMDEALPGGTGKGIDFAKKMAERKGRK